MVCDISIRSLQCKNFISDAFLDVVNVNATNVFGKSQYFVDRSGCICCKANWNWNQLTLKCTARSAWMHLQRKDADESACGKLHDPAFRITEIYFQEKLICNFWWKNGNYWYFTLDFGHVNAQIRPNIPRATRKSLMQREFHIRN